MVAQTNDTDCHKTIRKDYVEAQSEVMLEKTLGSGGGLKATESTDEECIAIMATVMSNTDINLQGCLGYKHTGTTVKFDGTEDHLICNDAKIFWEYQQWSGWVVTCSLGGLFGPFKGF